MKEHFKKGNNAADISVVTIGQKAVGKDFSPVIDDIPPDSVAVGIPARVIKWPPGPKD